MTSTDTPTSMLEPAPWWIELVSTGRMTQREMERRQLVAARLKQLYSSVPLWKGRGDGDRYWWQKFTDSGPALLQD